MWYVAFAISFLVGIFSFYNFLGRLFIGYKLAKRENIEPLKKKYLLSIILNSTIIIVAIVFMCLSGGTIWAAILLGYFYAPGLIFLECKDRYDTKVSKEMMPYNRNRIISILTANDISYEEKVAVYEQTLSNEDMCYSDKYALLEELDKLEFVKRYKKEKDNVFDLPEETYMERVYPEPIIREYENFE